MAKSIVNKTDVAATMKMLKNHGCCCKNCKYGRLVRSKPENPVLCECELEWKSNAKYGLFSRYVRYDLHVCELWEEHKAGEKQIFPLTPNPKRI